MARDAQIQVRRDTAANWTSTNPTLASGEMGFETDTLKFKIGNGSTAWTSLAYSAGTPQMMKMTAGNYYRTPGPGGAQGTAANQRTYFTPIFIPSQTTFDRIAIFTGSSFSGTSSVRLGVYNDTDGKPSTVAFDAGTVSCTAASTVYQITINETLNAGLYWLAFCQQTAPTAGWYWGTSASAVNVNPLFPAGATPGANNIQCYYETGITGAFATAGTLLTDTATIHVYLRD